MYDRESEVLEINLFFRKKNVCSAYSEQFAAIEPVITGGKIGNRKH